jgi:hypothetical protein
MLVGEARAAAKSWVDDHRTSLSGFVGAYYSGSTVGQADDAEMNPSSDMDVSIVISTDVPPERPGKFRFKGALLEVGFVDLSEVADAERVLSTHYLANSFRLNAIIADPSGRLLSLHQNVARRFAEPHWIRRRCVDALKRAEGKLVACSSAESWPDQTVNWLFGTSMTCVVPLVAALRNPTVRLRYLAARAVLDEFGMSSVYARILELTGCDGWSRQQTEIHLQSMANAFEAANAAEVAGYVYRSDISSEGRSVAIDGSRKLIADGDHREAVFWILATYMRCLEILRRSGNQELLLEHSGGLAAALHDLGIFDSSDLHVRAVDARSFLPEIYEVAESIVEWTGSR